jgi:hypothetical protein
MMGAAVIGGIGVEVRYRLSAERRLREAVEDRQQIELQFGEMLATHDRLKTELEQERHRSKELFEMVAAVRSRLEGTLAQLTEENTKGQELQTRLTGMQRYIDQLQGELAVTLQRAARTAGSEHAVQLERIVVSNAAGSDLAGRVVSINRDWDFVVIDLGWDAVHIGDTVSIFRGESLIAKARVERVQEGICAATMLPEWRAVDIQINDVVRVL